MTSHIQFGSKRIDYLLEYSERKTLGISVNPDLSVSVRAPRGASLDKIREKLHKRAPWIIKQQNFFLPFHPRTPPRKFVSGETHLYLGRQYRLRIERSTVESVKLKGAFLVVSTPDKTRARNLVQAWYAQNATARLRKLATPLIEKFKRHGVEPTEIVTRKMGLRWGSCTPQGRIIMNPELIKAPRGCIEYVVIHELCHLIHHDHTQKFLDLQSREMSDWEKWKSKLERLLS